MKKTTSLGFTLAELLISLLIIGVIATFTVPKILAAQQNQQKKAIFHETISALSAAVAQGVTTGTFTKTSLNSTYMPTVVNAVKLCPTNASTEGCWVNTSWVAEETEPGFIMHNGASVAGLRTTAAGWDKVVVD